MLSHNNLYLQTSLTQIKMYVCNVMQCYVRMYACMYIWICLLFMIQTASASSVVAHLKQCEVCRPRPTAFTIWKPVDVSTWTRNGSEKHMAKGHFLFTDTKDGRMKVKTWYETIAVCSNEHIVTRWVHFMTWRNWKLLPHSAHVRFLTNVSLRDKRKLGGDFDGHCL
jgi:hypothetical protein